MSIRLTDRDRDRLGVDKEWLDVDLETVTARETLVMKAGFEVPETGERVAYKHPDAWLQGLFGRVVTDPAGKPVVVDAIGEDNEPILDEDGQPKKIPVREPDWGAEVFLVWLALRRAGVAVPVAELDFDIVGRQLRFVRDEQDPAPEEPVAGSEGKDDAPGPGPGPNADATSTS